jgi:hypothetical protein
MDQRAGCGWDPWHPDGNRTPYPDPPCSRLADDAGLCLFHRPKRSDDELVTLDETDRQKSGEANTRFQSALATLLSDSSADEAGDWLDLRGFQFPTMDPGGQKLRRRVLFDESSWGAASSLQGADFAAGRRQA